MTNMKIIRPKSKDELKVEINRAIKKNGNAVDLNYIDTSEITDMSCLFENSDFNGDISKWDVSNVTNVSHMFYHAKSFNQDISKWDVSNVTDMSHLFRSTNSFNQDISKWDVSNVTNMSYMFYNAISFNQDISSWDVSNVKNTSYMFYYSKIEESAKFWFPELFV